MLERLARFVAVSAVGFPLNLGVTVFVHEVLGASEEVAFAIALMAVFLFNFAACRYIIYRATGGDPRRQLLKYVLFSAVFRLAEYAAFLLVHSVFNTQYLVAAVLVLGTSFFLKFRFYGKVVFTEGPRDPL
jgi:putative flippase GtrA